MVMTGEVLTKDNGIVEVSVKGSNNLGDHVVGTVRLEIPISGQSK
jgi:hypothetical protein